MQRIQKKFIRQAVDDCILRGDIRIKKGTNIVLHLARMNRDSDYFEDALVFRPERFADKNQAENFFPMGKGPKSCIGQYFAFSEMKPILVEFIKSFFVLRKSNTLKCITMKTKWDIAQQPVHEENVALLPIKNVILVGAHSVGKTTLAKYLVTKLNLVESLCLSSEIARNVIKELGVNGDQIRNNPNVCFLFQKAIIQKLHSNYLEISNKKFFIQDRCAIDALVYAKYFLGENNEKCSELFDMEETKRLINYYKQESIVFLIKPNENCLKNDGVRMMPQSIREWHEFSRMFERVMCELEIKYFLVDKLNLNERLMQVVEKINLF
jgi:nicotinamide riboside kinase